MQEFFYSPRNLYYRKNETIAGRATLVFVHGISGSSSAWLPYERKFEKEYNILTFDLRGHGKSGKPKGLKGYAISKFADDLFELIQFLGIDRPIIISHSFGSLIALEFIAKHMDVVDKAVFLSPNLAPKQIISGKIIRPLLELVKVFSLFPFNQKARGHVDYQRFANSGDWNIPRMIADIGMTSLPVYLYGTKQSYKVDYRDLAGKIDFPVLIMHGKKDSIFPLSGAVKMHEKIKNSRLIVLENSNHILVLNNFKEVSEAISGFIVSPSS
ncbi:alpha/beta hydrolase [Candidatus Falkowbacteria bacterium]|nr:alpha/beta hydrolase [Candidatus Falkowbacteria bacterium]